MKHNRRIRAGHTYARKNRSKFIIPALLLALLLMLTPLYALAEDVDSSDTISSSLGLSTSTLGESTVYYIYSAEDLQKTIDLGVSGETSKDYSKVVLKIEKDFSIGDVPEWTPLGTEQSPFNGTIEGSDHTIGGVGEDSRDTLLGYLKDATVKDLTVVTTKASKDSNPYYGLLKSAENCTIVNCHIQLLSPLSANNIRMLRSGIVADAAWETDGTNGGASANPQINDASQLWAFADAVTSGRLTFLGVDVTINGTIDCQNQAFPGIGSEENPFKGSLKGNNAVITNLNLVSANDFATGLIAYADPGTGTTTSSIEDITLQNVVVFGNNATGALLGYGKDVVVKNCSVSGSVSGNQQVGSLIGQLVITVPFINNDGSANAMAMPYVDTCYSTADVNGSMVVGGLVGKISEDGTPDYRSANESDIVISNCFTSGIINGNSEVGGIVGYLFGDYSAGNVSFAVGNSASLSTVNANVSVGGLVGTAATQYDGGIGAPPVINSYFAGTVKAATYAGGLVGYGGGAEDSYVSGNVVSPLAFSAKANSSVWPAIGSGSYSSSGSLPLDQPGVWVIPNTVYRPGDAKNVGTDVTSQIGGYLGLYGAGGDEHTPQFGTYSYFTSGTATVNGFTNGNITVDSSYDITGTFPSLSSFSSLGPVYSAFSAISTDAVVSTFPSQFYINGNNNATITKGSTTDFKLPSVSGLTWTMDGGTSLEVEDKTLPGGKNTITIQSDGTITADAPLNERLDVVIIGKTASNIGISLKFNVTFMDDAVRPILEQIPEEFIEDRTQASPELILDANLLTFKFPEGITGNPSENISLIEYSDKNFSTLSATHASGAKIDVLSENIIKVTIDKTLLKTDRSYMIDLGSAATAYKDLAGNTLNKQYYFRTISNSAPIITFDDTFDLYQKNQYGVNSTSAAKDVQIIGMTENDEDFNTYMEGVMVDNPNGQVLDLEDPVFGGSYTMDPGYKTMAGKNGYGPLTSPKTDFVKIPGEYTFTYKIPDFEDNSLMSNSAKRTYRVYSKAYFTRGNSPYSILTATFTSEDMVKIFKDMESGSLTINKAVENELIRRYLSDPSSPDYLSAYRYSYDGSKIDLPITFDVSGVTDAAFKDGFRQQLTVKAGDSEQIMVLDINGTISDYEIEVDGNVYSSTNTLSRSGAIRFFNARVRQKSTGKLVDFPVEYNFKKVHSNNYDVPQPVTLTMLNPSGVKSINGVDMTVTRTVSVILVKENIYKHPEDVEDFVTTFWEKTATSVKMSDKDKVLDYKLTYDDAARTPANFFLVAKNRDGEAINMTLPSGIKLSFEANKINKALTFMDGINYNLVVEPMYDVYIARDAKGSPVQQFYTPGEFTMPGAMVVEVPLNENMPTAGLNLYRVDETTNRYVLISKLTEKQTAGGKVVLEMKAFQGKYVMTATDLDGKIVGSNY